MSTRAAIILLDGDKVALIERHRQGLHYFTFPGGHVDEGETPMQAAQREAMEELGVEVSIKKLVAQMQWQGKWQYYFLAEVNGGSYGTGRGEEMVSPLPERGTYHPTWLPVGALLEQPVKPRQVAELVQCCAREGWPKEPVTLAE